MARNLRDKIRAIVNDSYDIRQESVVTKIENLIKDELQLRDEERTLTPQDVMLIKSTASKEFADMRLDQEFLGYLHGDQESVRTLCLINATVSFLRMKGLTSALLTYKK